jgi:hypothetical protein
VLVPAVLVATTTTSSPAPRAVPAGTVKFTRMIPDSPAPSDSSFGSTLLTNRRASVTAILNVRREPMFRTVNVGLLRAESDAFGFGR